MTVAGVDGLDVEAPQVDTDDASVTPAFAKSAAAPTTIGPSSPQPNDTTRRPTTGCPPPPGSVESFAIAASCVPAVSRAYNRVVPDESLANWSPRQIAAARRWVQTWKQAGPRLERVRRAELRRLDPQRAIALLCGEADYTVPPRAPRPTSGLVEQQRWFMKAALRRD